MGRGGYRAANPCGPRPTPISRVSSGRLCDRAAVILWELSERLRLRETLTWLYRVRITGAEHVPAGACILVASHESVIDPWFLCLATTRRVLINVGRSFNLTERQLFWKILFPSAMPTIFVGVRLGLIFALINIVGVEFLINFGGLGQLINELSERYDLAGTYASICFVILVSVIVFMATERAERWLRPGN